jgi:hypothetical protein
MLGVVWGDGVGGGVRAVRRRRGCKGRESYTIHRQQPPARPPSSNVNKTHRQDVGGRAAPALVKVARRELGRRREDVDEVVGDALALGLGELGGIE